MSFSLNRAQVLGNIGREPEIRYTANANVAVMSFSVATTFGKKGDDGQWQNETTWHNIVLFNPQDYIKNALHRGTKVYCEGRLQYRSYDGKDGVKRQITEIICEKIVLLEGRPGGSDALPPESSSAAKGEDTSYQTDDDLPF